MAITDYIPNVFGSAAPTTYEGLLGMGLITPEQMAQTKSTANIQGLLGAGLALAQGMSKIGPRRSAAENILGALAGGFGAAGGAYQQGLQNIVQQQQLQSAALTQQQALNRQAAITAAGREDPALAQLLMIDPAEGAKQLALKRQLGVLGGQTGAKTPQSLRDQAQQIYASGNAALKPLGDALMDQADRLEIQGVPQPQVQPQAQPQVQPQVAAAQEVSLPVDQQTGEKILPVVTVTEKPVSSRIKELTDKADVIRQEMDRLSDPRLAANKSVQNAFERNKTKLEEIRKQISEAAVAETDLEQFRATAPEQFKQQIDNLQQLSMKLTPDQLSQRMGDISKQINEYKQKETEFNRAQTNYQNEAYRIAQEVAPGVDPSKYTSQQIAEIQKRLVKQEKELRIAGRTLVTQTMYGDKEFLKQRIGKAVEAEEQAIGALNVANDVRAIVDVLKPYKGGKIDEFKASIGSYLPDTSMAQIATANDLAVAIRARVAPTLRVPGSGATSDFETKQFLAAIPSLLQYANGRDLMAVYAERLANRAVAAADLRSKMIENGTYSVKNFQQTMKDQGLERVFTNDELAKLRSGKTEPESTLPADVRKKYGL